MKLKQLLKEITFHDIAKKKNKWLKLLDTGNRKAIADNLWVLIDTAYAPLGGNISIKTPNDVFNSKYTYWEAVDDDGDPDADAVIFGQKRNGFKIGGIGHDGKSKSKSDLIKKLINQLNINGYWVEASLTLGNVLYSKGATYVKDQNVVEKVFNQKVEWLNDKGKYKREVSKGKFNEETIFGKPKI